MAEGLQVNTGLLKRARQLNGWTLRDVTARTKELAAEGKVKRAVDFANLARYERGEVKPLPGTLYALSLALDLDMDDLLLPAEDAA